jgi:O-antigen/teichoic acid export membrane protein
MGVGRLRPLVSANPASSNSAMHLKTILRNILSTWAGYVVTLLVGFVLAPIIVHRLGSTRYGVWTLVVSLTGYFGILDLGLRQSVGRFVARYMALRDEANVNRTISNAIAMLGAAAVLGFLGTVIANFCFGIFNVDPGFQSDARIALLIAGVNICIALPMSVFNAVLFSLERFDVVTGITIVGALTRFTLVILVLSRGHGLIALALATLIASSAEYISAAVCAKALYRPLAPRRSYVSRAGCKSLFTFGIYRFVWIVANQLIFYTDSLVIGVFLNAAAITYYVIAGSLINYGRNIVSLASDTFFPAATKLDAKGDLAGLRELLVLGTRIALAVGLPLCLGLLFLGRQFIVLWMGPAFAVSAVYLTVLVIPQFTSVSQYITSLILVSMAKHKVLAYVALGEGLANLLLSVILVRRMGLIGVAWGTVIPHAISTAVIIPLYTVRMLNMKWSEYIIRGFVRPVIAASPAAAACYGLSILVERPSWYIFVLEVIGIGLMTAVMNYYVCLTPEQRSWLVEKVQGLRFKPAQPQVVKR